MERSSMAPLLLRNSITSLFFFADKSLAKLAGNHRLLQTIRRWLAASFLFFLRLLPSLFPSLNPDSSPLKSHAKKESFAPSAAAGDSGISRALSQLLLIVNNLPASSRKYELVRGLAEGLVDENQKEGVEVLREVNRAVLAEAFGRTLGQIEALVAERSGADGGGTVQFRFKWILRAVRDVALTRTGAAREEELTRSGIVAEKLAAELVWLSRKMGACGFAEEAVWRWASASNLAWLALSAEPRLQGYFLKLSAFLFKQAKEMAQEECVESMKKDQQKKTMIKLLTSWLPLLCRATNGTDVPVLTTSQKAELEKVLEETIEMLEREEQEQVLSLWLHHFVYSPSSDWPNLQASYTRWCTVSRKHLLLR